jgi:hypothetical protein
MDISRPDVELFFLYMKQFELEHESAVSLEALILIQLSLTLCLYSDKVL